MKDSPALGSKIRGLRRREGMTQVQLAERLGISPSYLNLIEHNRRSLTAPLLIKLAQVFQLDLRALSGENDARFAADLLEVFGDPLFEGHDLTATEVRDLVAHSPGVGRAVLNLYRGYRSARESAAALALRLSEGDELAGIDRSRLPNEEVGDLIQRHGNHFPELEEGAEMLWRAAGLSLPRLYEGLVRHLEEFEGIEVRIEKVGAMGGALRRYDRRRRVLTLSEVLRRGSRNFQLAHQVGLLTQRSALERIVKDPLLTSEPSRSVARVALANYFAAAVLMPYRDILEAARSERYDIEVLGHRFRTSFEQVCHRLTTLRRPGAEGVPFHFVRIDVAGNISKRFSASGLRFARFSGACPRWNVFAAFLTPGMIRTQIAQMPDGTTYFWIARTLRKDGGGYHSPHTVFAVGLGCELSHARQLIYAEGVDLDAREAAVPVGITCRLCERMECEQRAFPPLQHPLALDENVRGVSFYAPVGDR
ncbi:MAG TPA: short-chain fatty acyl-CoA regulator family protein [Vicinamibacteria bacterium]|nr:short-chain fatty acyl-CoA regulator family protein [Vicinamibacteria bacterium]